MIFERSHGASDKKGTSIFTLFLQEIIFVVDAAISASKITQAVLDNTHPIVF